MTNEDEGRPAEHSSSSEGRLWIVPKIISGQETLVTIVGDPAGLVSFGRLLISAGEADQTGRGIPIGEHYDVVLQPEYNYGFSGELGAGSCTVEVCRADAAGTGEIYPELLAAEREVRNFQKDTTPPPEWLELAKAALSMAEGWSGKARASSAYSILLANHSAFCSLMAALRSWRVPVPESPEFYSQLMRFVPNSLVIPLPLEVIEDMLIALDRFTAPGFEVQDEVPIAPDSIDHAREMYRWAEEIIAAASGE
jgi:hypothetical protein